MSQSRSAQVWRWQDGALREGADEVAVEEPLEIRVHGRPVTVTMRTPGDDAELAAGLLLTEGLVRGRADIVGIEPCPRNEWGNAIDVRLVPDMAVDFYRMSRHAIASSSCGVCGKTSIEAIHHHAPPIDGAGRAGPELDPAWMAQLAVALRAAQPVFHRTGGVHAAAVFDHRGELVVLREDVGRHNAVDKVVGFGLLAERLPWEGHVLLVSGRASFEIMQKALAARLPVVAAISAPSSLAVAFAEQSGQTLVGFLRDGSLNVYAGAERLVTHWQAAQELQRSEIGELPP